MDGRADLVAERLGERERNQDFAIARQGNDLHLRRVRRYGHQRHEEAENGDRRCTK